MRFIMTMAFVALCLPMAFAQEKGKPSAADEAIQSAINQLDKQLEKIDDMEGRQKLMKAIEHLEDVLEGDAKPPAESLEFEVKPLVLKKKFQGRATYDAKSGELTIVYDFLKKEQLKDFNLNDAKVAVVNKAMLLDGGDTVTHIAKFKAFTVSGVFGIKAMRNGGISSTNGSHLGMGGLNPDTLYLGVPGGGGAHKIVPDKLRSGSIPFSLTVTPRKTSIVYGPERLSQPTVKKEDIHQVLLVGGTEGMGFANLAISGIPEPKWFKEFLEGN